MAKKWLLVISITSLTALNYGNAESTSQTDFESHFRQKYSHLDIPPFQTLQTSINPTSKYQYPLLERQILAKIYEKQQTPYMNNIGYVSNALAAYVLLAPKITPAISILNPYTAVFASPARAAIAASVTTAVVPRMVALTQHLDGQTAFVEKNYQPTETEQIIAQEKARFKNMPLEAQRALSCTPMSTAQITQICQNELSFTERMRNFLPLAPQPPKLSL